MKRKNYLIPAAALMAVLCGCGNTQYGGQGVQNQTYQYKELTAMIDDLQDMADKVKPETGAAAKHHQYIELKTEINEAEEAIEVYEDDLEYQLESGMMSYEDYNRKDAKREALEQTLEGIDDQVKQTFGVAD